MGTTKMVNPIKVVKYQLYLLQLENYELGRFFKLLFRKGIVPPKGPLRKSIVWTMKAWLLFVLALVSHILLLVGAAFFISNHGLSVVSIMYLVVSVAAVFLYFILYSLYVILLWPVDFVLKQIIIARAKSKISGFRDLKIIGVAGSYGKTTMKEILREVLGSKYKVLSTPDSVNTPVGIARWILKVVEDNTEIVIIEMGEHYTGDITEICEITKPDISVVTGINEAHLERMKRMETVVAAVFEIVSSTKPGGLVVLNGDDEKVVGNYKKFIWPDVRVEQFSFNNFQFSIFDPEKLLWQGELDGLGKIEVKFLGQYALGDVDAAAKIAKSLGMSNQEIIDGIKNIKPVEHRLKPIKSAGDVLVIDDAYNGNPNGAAEAIKVLSRFTNRRKIYITPGLVEMGAKSKEVHQDIGKQLAGVADVVILIRNSVTGDIASQLVSSSADQPISGLRKPEIIWFNTAQEAHAALPTILKSGDVILFQNDWGDQYT